MPIDPSTVSQDERDLAAGWITLHKTEVGSPEHEDRFWAFEQMQELYRSEYHKAWRIILLIWSMDQSDKIKANLSAGPMEDLIESHGEEMISLVETEARQDPSFANMLGGMWRSGSDEVWGRIKSVWDKRGWHSHPDD
jgi:hypothetical protein